MTEEVEKYVAGNRERFLMILKAALEERGRSANYDTVVSFLDNSDFWTAPASTKYHCSFDGGLVKHCLDVYDNMVSLVEMKHLENEIPMHSIAIVSLFHDIAKRNLYEKGFKNVQKYNPNGKKDDYDGRGPYDWVKEDIWKVKEPSVTDGDNLRFVFGSHEETSEYIASKLVPLSLAESVAILTHHAGMSWDSAKTNVSEVYNKYPIATMLHLADMMSAYIDETTIDE